MRWAGVVLSVAAIAAVATGCGRCRRATGAEPISGRRRTRSASGQTTPPSRSTTGQGCSRACEGAGCKGPRSTATAPTCRCIGSTAGADLLSAGPEAQFAGKYLSSVDPVGGAVQRIAKAAGGTSLFAVAPVTRRIAFGDADNNVFVAGQDGSSKRKVGAGAVGGWAPDGKRLAVAGGGLEVIDVDAGTTKQVAGRVGVDGIGFVPASWSKQGRLAFIENVGRCGGPD